MSFIKSAKILSADKKTIIGRFYGYNKLEWHRFVCGEIVHSLHEVTSTSELKPGTAVYMEFEPNSSKPEPIMITDVDDNYTIDDTGNYVYFRVYGREMTKLEKFVNRMITCTT